MRIALVPSAYAPAVGGVEELTARLGVRLRDAGEAVEVWTIRHPAALPTAETIGGLQVRRFLLPMPRMAPRALLGFPGEAARAWRPLARAAREFRPDVIHVQCFSSNGAYAAALARRLGVPLLVSLQGETVMDDHDIYEHSLALRRSLRWGLRRAAAVTGCSAYVLADAERRFGLAAGAGVVIPNGVERSEGVPGEALNLPFERFVFAVGRFVEKKGFDLLLDAFEQLAPAHADLGLVIGGDGAARAGLLARAQAAGLAGRVALPGRLSRAQVAWAMDAASVFVLPSRVEPFGIVVLEALRAGCPAVVSSRGGATDIVTDSVDGLVADPFDRAALAGAIERVIDDASLAARLAAAGPPRAAQFDWSLVTARYRELYERVAS